MTRRFDGRGATSSLPTLLACLAAVGAGLYGSLYCLWGNPVRGLAGLALGALLLSPSLAAQDRHAVKRGQSPWWGLALVGTALVFFRCYRLVPPGLWGDDAINGLIAFDVLDGHIHSPFELVQHSHSFFHALTNYTIAAAFRLFGPGPAALRLPGIVAGITAGVAFYAALLPLFGRSVALVAGLFFAASPLQINHSKNLIQEVFGLASLCIGVAGLVYGFDSAPVRAARSDGLGADAPPDSAPVRAARSDGLGADAPPDSLPSGERWGQRGAVLVAAVAFAAAIYTYHSAKSAPLIALPYLFAVRRRGLRREQRRTLALAAAVFLLCLLPAVFSYAHDPGKLTRRFAGVSLLTEIRSAGNLRPLWESLWRTAAVFHYQEGPPRYHWFGVGDEPALDPIVAFLAVPGLLLSLRRWRQPRHLLLLTWFAIGMLPGVLSTEAPRGYRVLLATPPLYAWAALSIAALWQAGATGAAVRVQRGVAAVLVAGALFVDFNYYFYRTYTHPDFLWMQGERQVAMARVLRQHGPGWRGYLLTPRFTADFETMRFLARAWDLSFADVTDLAGIMPLNDPPTGGALFITTPGTHEAAKFLQAFYADAAIENIDDPQPRSWFFGGDWPYTARKAHPEPVATIIAVSGEELRRAAARRGPRWRPVVAEYKPRRGEEVLRRAPPPFFNFFPDNFPAMFSARFSGALFVPAPGGYTLEVRADGEVKTRVDGVAVDRRPVLSAGRHRIDIELPSVERRLRLSVWWIPRGGIPALVPYHAWRPVPLHAAAQP